MIWKKDYKKIFSEIKYIIVGTRCCGGSEGGKYYSRMALKWDNIHYYVEKIRFTVIEDFIKKQSSSSGTAVTIDTVNFHIEGKAGSGLPLTVSGWKGGNSFLWSMKSMGRKSRGWWWTEPGRYSNNVRNGFDREVKKAGKVPVPIQAEEIRQKKP